MLGTKSDDCEVWNIMRNEKKTIEQKILLRLFIILLLYSVIGFFVIALFGNIFSETDNPVILWLSWRLDMIYIFYIAIGYFCIFYYYWKKPWNYLNEVISAAKTIYEQNDHTIALSAPLRDVENQMNQIKMSVLLIKQAAKEAEDRKNELVM